MPEKRIYRTTTDPTDWRALLAADQHWQRGRSAFELAMSWELAARSVRGLPDEIAALLDAHPATANAALLLAIPEYRVQLKARGRGSQNDLWAVLTSDTGLVSMMVEGKAEETFGPAVGQWLRESRTNRSDDDETPTGREVRLKYLQEILELAAVPESLRYQLLHRTASALIQAKRVRASAAVMIVQAFGPNDRGWDDFAAFGDVLGVRVVRGSLSALSTASGMPLLFGWVDSGFAAGPEAAVGDCPLDDSHPRGR
jgi:hypothetical protein